MASSAHNITQLLQAWGAGNDEAGRTLIEIVYKELRRLAGHYMQTERPDHTLQPTALVHELFIKLFSGEPIEWRDRGHFLAVAARQLRHIVVDYARQQKAHKRGGEYARIELSDAPDVALAVNERLLDLDQALDRLAELDARAAQVVELRYFGGLADEEVGEALGVSVASVKRDWQFAKTWLLKEME